jgi:hypothetical protein
MDMLMTINFRSVGQLENFIKFLKNKIENRNTPPEERRALSAIIPQLENGAHPN